MRTFIFLIGLLPAALTAETVIPISRAQAESMVAVEMAAKEADRAAKKIDFTVLQRRTYNMGDRTMTLERAAPPVLPERETKPKPAPPTPAEQQAFQEMIQQYQQAKLISLQAVVYDNYGTPITHLRWQYNGKTYEAWSEADFSYFRTLHEFSLDQQKYRLTMFILNESVAEMEKRRVAARAGGVELNLPEIPVLPAALEGVSEYFLIADDPSVFDDAAAFIPLDHAHQYYDANVDALQVKLDNQNALNAAKKRYLEQNPPSKDTTLTYWIDEK